MFGNSIYYTIKKSVLGNDNMEIGKKITDLRKNNKLSCISINIVRKNTFDNIKKFLISKGVSKSQIKIPRVITTN